MEKNYGETFAPWQRANIGLQPWWSYSFVNNSAFYARIPAQFQTYMRRYVQNPLWWNDGWCPYFHNSFDGLFSTGLGGAIVKRLADKVFGSKLYYKNDSTDEVESDVEKIKPCESVNAMREWSEKVNFDKVVHKAIGYALAAGTAAIKLNRNSRGELWADAWRFDKFFPCVNGDGSIESVTFFIMLNVPFSKATARDEKTVYTLEEKRYFGDYERVTGEVLRNVPLVCYEVHKMYGTITNNAFSSDGTSETVCWRDLPKSIKKYINESFSGMRIGEPILLPFDDWLGVELVNATDGIPSLPELPFGESILRKIIPQLQAFDYAFSASCTDMYIGKGRVLVPKGIMGASNGQANSGLDSFMYERIEYVNPDDQKPVPLQFDTRSTEWRAQFENILNLISVIIGVSPSTLASFLQDNSPKTAREVSTQENETMQFVTSTRGVVERPINRILNEVRKYKGLPDKVALRWSYAGMENPYINAETLAIAVQNGFISKWKAIQRFNYDDNDVQLAQEYKRIQEDAKNSSFGNSPFIDDERQPYFGNEVTGYDGATT